MVRPLKAPYCIRNPFHQQPDFGAASTNYELSELLAQAGPPINCIRYKGIDQTTVDRLGGHFVVHHFVKT